MTRINNETKVLAAKIAETAKQEGISPAELRRRGNELLDSSGVSFPFDNKELQKMGKAFLLAADQLAAATEPLPLPENGATA